MPPEILVLVDKPILLIAILFVGALAGMMAERFATERRRAAWKAKNEWRWEKKGRGKVSAGPWTPKPDAIPDQVPDAADQLRIESAGEKQIGDLRKRLGGTLVQPIINKNWIGTSVSIDRCFKLLNLFTKMPGRPANTPCY